MVHFQKIATVAAIGAASYVSASPVEKVQVVARGSPSFNDSPSAWTKCAPWLPSSLPSWQLGCSAPGIPQWTGGDQAQCSSPWNMWTPFCLHGNPNQPLPAGCKPPTTGGQSVFPVCDDGYQQVYSDYQTTPTSGVYAGQTVGAATIDNANYLTYILVKDTDSCLKACDQTKNCVFVNIYQDNASSPSDVSGLPASAQPKYVKGNLTCAMFKACSGTDKATNYAGQQDPTYITDSSAYCKGGECIFS